MSTLETSTTSGIYSRNLAKVIQLVPAANFGKLARSTRLDGLVMPNLDGLVGLFALPGNIDQPCGTPAGKMASPLETAKGRQLAATDLANCQYVTQTPRIPWHAAMGSSPRRHEPPAMDWTEITLLAVVQGIAEFLPISSSGHLVILGALLGVSGEVVDVNIVLHAGTLGSILAIFWQRIVRLLTADRRVIGLLLMGTLPAVVVGLLIKKVLIDTYHFEVLQSPLLAGCMLPVTGALLLWTKDRNGEGEYAQLTYRQALIIGSFQAFALLPGISRSGSTIVAGLLVGLRREAAATFSFLLAIPAIAAASGNQLVEAATSGGFKTEIAVLAFGFTLAFAVGVAALWWLLKIIARSRLHWFAWWCIPAGIATIVWQLTLGGEPTAPLP